MVPSDWTKISHEKLILFLVENHCSNVFNYTTTARTDKEINRSVVDTIISVLFTCVYMHCSLGRTWVCRPLDVARTHTHTCHWSYTAYVCRWLHTLQVSTQSQWAQSGRPPPHPLSCLQQSLASTLHGLARHAQTLTRHAFEHCRSTTLQHRCTANNITEKWATIKSWVWKWILCAPQAHRTETGICWLEATDLDRAVMQESKAQIAIVLFHSRWPTEAENKV